MKISKSKWFQLVRVIAPVVLAAVPGGDKITPIIPVVVEGIEAAEQIAGASGAQKKAHVLRTVEAGVAAANATGHVQLDPQEVQDVASAGIDAVIGAINVVEGARVEKVPDLPKGEA